MQFPELANRKTYVLFIKGVSREDFISPEDFFDEKVKEISGDVVSEKRYDKLPVSVIGVKKSWPDHTNILCWNDGFEFSTVPIPLVYDIKERGCEKDSTVPILEYIVKRSAFCSMACCATYIEQHFTREQQWNLLHNTKLFYKELTGKTIDHIQPAPDRTLLIPYGGDLSIKSYRLGEASVWNK